MYKTKEEPYNKSPKDKKKAEQKLYERGTQNLNHRKRKRKQNRNAGKRNITIHRKKTRKSQSRHGTKEEL